MWTAGRAPSRACPPCAAWAAHWGAPPMSAAGAWTSSGGPACAAVWGGCQFVTRLQYACSSSQACISRLLKHFSRSLLSTVQCSELEVSREIAKSLNLLFGGIDMDPTGQLGRLDLYSCGARVLAASHVWLRLCKLRTEHSTCFLIDHFPRQIACWACTSCRSGSTGGGRKTCCARCRRRVSSYNIE